MEPTFLCGIEFQRIVQYAANGKAEAARWRGNLVGRPSAEPRKRLVILAVAEKLCQAKTGVSHKLPGNDGDIFPCKALFRPFLVKEGVEGIRFNTRRDRWPRQE